MRGGWTYIMTNHVRGVLYIGVTADLAGRVDEVAGKGDAPAAATVVAAPSTRPG